MKRIIVRKEQLPIEIMSTMGCRTQNGADINAVTSYENNVKNVIEYGVPYDDIISAAQKDGRGNICPATLILPTLAMQVKEKLDKKIEKRAQYSEGGVVGDYEETLVNDFLKLLDKKINEAKDSLIERFDWITSQPAASAKFMYENGTMYGYKKEEGIKSALKHGTLAIGQLGLAETLHILIGENHAAPKQTPSREDIVTKMIEKIESKENRKLSEDEVSEIKRYVNSK